MVVVDFVRGREEVHEEKPPEDKLVLAAGGFFFFCTREMPSIERRLLLIVECERPAVSV